MTDSRVSWRHAVLRVDGAQWVLEDLGSTNGTFLGLQRLDRIEISGDCVVRLGNPDDGPVLRLMPQVRAHPPSQATATLDADFSNIYADTANLGWRKSRPRR